MIPRAIHQFHPGAEYGDGITNGMLFLQRILQQSGYRSDIYCAHSDQRIPRLLRPVATFEDQPTDVLLVHYSLGSDYDDWISNLKCRRILVYHNITPAELLPEGSELRRLAETGRAQLAAWAKAPVFDTAIGDSTTNVEELERLGYRSPAAIPLLVDLDRIRSRARSPDWAQKLIGSRNLLFVGRVCDHKGQLDLVRMMDRLMLICNFPVRLMLVGGTTSPQYLTAIEGEISRCGLGDAVRLLGKLDDGDLYALYGTADLYVSLSRHEGFGMPLVESMAFDLPVIAASAGNVAVTLGTGGLVLETRDPDHVAGVVKLLLEEPWLRRQVILGQRQSLARYERPVLVAALQQHLHKAGVEVTLECRSESSPARSDVWRIEGPFDSSYSLAIVNRELARALRRRGETVALLSRDGPGPIKVNEAFLAENPDLLAMTARAAEGAMPAVTLRNLYPPTVADMRGVLRVLANYAWEESGFPAAYVEEFNATLDLICVTSRFVAKILRDNGIHTPIRVVGNGIDHVFGDAAPGRRRERQTVGRDATFRFLHVSSGFPRKGIDALLAAWAAAFSCDDAVVLVLKTFPNIHNRIEEELPEWKRANPCHAPVQLINEDLSQEAIRDLYGSADAIVCPSRGEGFGLPLAEALAVGKPVITTAYGGQSDFCTDKTAWLCDFSFAYARTHVGAHSSVWVEPHVESLSKCLRECWQASPEERSARGEAGRALVRSQYRWDAVAERTQKAVADVRTLSADMLRLPKVGWVSTWNSRCGIAAYSRSLTAAIEPERLIVFANRNATPFEPDGLFVRRCWQQGWDDPLDDLHREIRAADVDVVVMQFNFGFFGLRSFGRLIERLGEEGVPVFAVLHSTADVEKPDITIRLRDAKQSLALARRILVHSVHDLNRLKAMGLIENVALFPMGVPQPVARERAATRKRLGLNRSRLVLATFGYLLPHKGLRELIRATAVLRREMGGVDLLMLNALYPAEESESEYQACREEIAALGLNGHVRLVTDFLGEPEIVSRLAASDMVVYPYQETQESASAAVRLGLASLAPVVCTPLAIFDDVGSVISRLPGTSPQDIAKGLRELATSRLGLSELTERQRAWVAAHSWTALGRRLDGLLRGEMTEGFATSDIAQARLKAG